jgi:RNA polymerase sigma-70 factor (ECF subfamily)
MDKKFFNKFITDLRPKLYRFALSYTRRADEAEDVVQETVLKLWERNGEADVIKSLEAYAMRSVKNRCLDYNRSPLARTDQLQEDESIHNSQNPYIALEQADMVAFVKKLVERLPQQQQMVIRLRDIEGYELEEIANILDMNDNAVRTNLSRARLKIREELLKHYI